MVTSLRSVERSSTGRTGEAKSTLKPMAGKEARRDQCCNLIIVLAERSPALAEPLYSDQKKLQVLAPSARMSAPGRGCVKTLTSPASTNYSYKFTLVYRGFPGLSGLQEIK